MNNEDESRQNCTFESCLDGPGYFRSVVCPSSGGSVMLNVSQIYLALIACGEWHAHASNIARLALELALMAFCAHCGASCLHGAASA